MCGWIGGGVSGREGEREREAGPRLTAARLASHMLLHCSGKSGFRESIGGYQGRGHGTEKSKQPRTRRQSRSL